MWKYTFGIHINAYIMEFILKTKTVQLILSSQSGSFSISFEIDSSFQLSESENFIKISWNSISLDLSLILGKQFKAFTIGRRTPCPKDELVVGNSFNPICPPPPPPPLPLICVYLCKYTYEPIEKKN